MILNLVQAATPLEASEFDNQNSKKHFIFGGEGIFLVATSHPQNSFKPSQGL